jgi:hypothetical protein
VCLAVSSIDSFDSHLSVFRHHIEVSLSTPVLLARVLVRSSTNQPFLFARFQPLTPPISTLLPPRHPPRPTGVDYPGVSLVLQVGLTDRESYIHRLGRTARAGSSGQGVLLLADFEAPFLKQLRYDERCALRLGLGHVMRSIMNRCTTANSFIVIHFIAHTNQSHKSRRVAAGIFLYYFSRQIVEEILCSHFLFISTLLG